MSHLKPGALFLVVTAFLAVNAVRAQQPSADATSATQSSEQAKSESSAKPAPPPQTVSASEPPANNSKKAESTPAQVTTIVVNGGPSADILRSARDAGFKIKIADGTTHFCKTEAPVGTRFVSESCMNEQQVTLWLSRAQYQREKINNLLVAPASAH
jgi:hypothetical protein